MSYMLEEAEECTLPSDAVCPKCNRGELIAVWIQGEIGYDAKKPQYERFKEWVRFEAYSCECGYQSDDSDDFNKEGEKK